MLKYTTYVSEIYEMHSRHLQVHTLARYHAHIGVRPDVLDHISAQPQ